RYIPPEPGQAHGKVIADLHILGAASWLWSLISEAVEIGKPDLVGLSIDIFGHWHHDQSHDAKAVTRVVALNSCDIVTRPSAGGSLNHILHSVETELALLTPTKSLQMVETNAAPSTPPLHHRDWQTCGAVGVVPCADPVPCATGIRNTGYSADPVPTMWPDRPVYELVGVNGLAPASEGVTMTTTIQDPPQDQIGQPQGMVPTIPTQIQENQQPESNR